MGSYIVSILPFLLEMIKKALQKKGEIDVREIDNTGKKELFIESKRERTRSKKESYIDIAEEERTIELELYVHIE